MAAYSGLLQLARDKDTPIPDKLKLLKFAWAKPEVAIPNKHQEILDFVCGLLVDKSLKDTFEGQDEILVWECLSKFLTASKSSISVRPPISKVVTEKMRVHLKRKAKGGKPDSKCLSPVLECGYLLLDSQDSSFADKCKQLSILLQLSLSGDGDVEKARAFVKSLAVQLVHQKDRHQEDIVILASIVDMMPHFLNYQAAYGDPDLQHFMLTILFHRIPKNGYLSLVGLESKGKGQQLPVNVARHLRFISHALFPKPSEYLVTSFLPAFVEEFLRLKKLNSDRCFNILRYTLELLQEKGPSSQQGRLSGLAKCFQACVRIGCDIFATTQPQTIANWLQNVLDFVLPHYQQPFCYSILSSLLILRPAHVDRCLTRILTGAMTRVDNDTKETELARDAFLSELVTTFLKLRRVPYFHQCLIQVIWKGKSITVTSSSLQKFREKLNVMFNEVPISSVATMWTDIKTKLESTIPVPAEGNTNDRIIKQSWLLLLLNSLLSHTQFFDQRSMGVMEDKLHTLLEITEYNVFKPLAKEYNSNEMPMLTDALVTWAYLKMLLYPKWREQAKLMGGGVKEDKDAKKLMKKVSLPAKVQMILQRQQVLTSGDTEKKSNYTRSCEEVNELVEEQLESVTLLLGKGNNSGNDQQLIVKFQEFFEIFRLVARHLSDELVEGWAKAIVTLANRSQQAHTADPSNVSRFYDELDRFLNHPTTMEHRRLQTHLACLMWRKLLVPKCPDGSPKKKKKRTSLSSEDSDNPVSKMYQFITDPNLESADFVVDPDEIAGKLAIAEPVNSELLQLLSILSVEFLPALCHKSQLALISMAACLPSLDGTAKDKVSKLVEKGLIQYLSGRDLAPFFSCISPDKFLQFSLSLCSQDRIPLAQLGEIWRFCIRFATSEFGRHPAKRYQMSGQYLQCCTSVVMDKYNQSAILSIQPVIKKLVEEMDSGGGDVDSTKRMLKATSALIHSYGQCKFNKVKGAATSAKEIFYLLSKVVFKKVGSWIGHDGFEESRKKKKSRKSLEKVGKKRKLADIDNDDNDWMEMDQSEKGSDSGTSLMSHAVTCMTEILMVWSRDSTNEEMNPLLAAAVSVVHQRLMGLDDGPAGKESEQTKLLRLNFMKAVCECQKRFASPSSSPRLDSSMQMDTPSPTKKKKNTSTSSSYLFPLFDEKGIFDFWQNIFALASSKLSALLPSSCNNETQSSMIIKGDNDETVSSNITTTTISNSNKTRFGKNRNTKDGNDDTANLSTIEGEKNTTHTNDDSNDNVRETGLSKAGFVFEETKLWPKQLILCMDILLDVMEIGAMGGRKKTDHQCENGSDKDDNDDDDKMFGTLLASLTDHLNSPSESDLPSVIVSLAVWRRMATLPFVINHRPEEMLDQIYLVLGRCSSLLQHFNHSRIFAGRKSGGTKITSSSTGGATEGDDMTAAISRFILRTVVKFITFAKETNHPALTIVCLQVAPHLSLVSPPDIRALQKLVNAFLFFHPRSAVSAISTVLALVSKLVCACVQQSNQNRLFGRGQQEVEELVDSAKLVSRVLMCLTEGVVRDEVIKFGHCVIYDYVMELQKGALHPKVKRELIGGLYELLNVCGHSYLTALNASLPSDAKTTFKFMHQEYEKFYKYSHNV